MMTQTLKQLKIFFRQYSFYFGLAIIIIGIITAITFLIIGNYIIIPGSFDPYMIYLFSGFMGGTIGSLFSLAGYIIIYNSFQSQQKQNIESVYFNMFENFNRLRFNFLVSKIDDKEFYGISIFIEVYKKIGLKTEDLHEIESIRLNNFIQPYFNEIFCYISSLESLMLHLENSKDDLMNYFDIYFSQLVLSLSDYERYIIVLYYYSKSTYDNQLINKIKSTPNTVHIA